MEWSSANRDLQQFKPFSSKETLVSSSEAAGTKSTELVTRWKAGDQAAAAELVDRYQQKLLYLVGNHLSEKLRSRVDAEDLVQSILKSAFRVTRDGETVFSDDTGFWKWLVTVGLNKTFKRVNREMADKRSPDREASNGHTDEMYSFQLDRQVPTEAEVAEVADLTEAILAKLDETQGKILLMRMQGHRQREIAKELKVSEKKVQRNAAKIREAATEILGEEPPALE